jgi:hypothetical protein
MEAPAAVSEGTQPITVATLTAVTQVFRGN